MVSLHRRLGSAFAALSLLIPITTFLPASVVPSTFLPSTSIPPAETYVVVDKPLTRQSAVYSTAGEWIATLTHGTRTVVLAGPRRTFAEATATAPVITSLHVRLLPTPFTGTVDQRWLDSARADTSPDLLDMAAQYVHGAPDLLGTGGLRIGGDAGYGPTSTDGTAQSGADFNDYLGIGWQYAGKADPPEADQLGALDCSGFIRMLFGYRGGMGMSIAPSPGQLPRRTFQMFADAPGRIIHESPSQLASFGRIQPGDLVFFDATPDPSNQIDHVGMFLGVDTDGKNRFISSRKSAAGPTIGDVRGRSVLDGTGYFADAFRAVRRL